MYDIEERVRDNEYFATYEYFCKETHWANICSISVSRQVDGYQRYTTITFSGSTGGTHNKTSILQNIGATIAAFKQAEQRLFDLYSKHPEAR